MRELVGLVRACDVYWHNNLSLRTAWPQIFCRRRFVITHQGSYCYSNGRLDVLNQVKHVIANHSCSVAISGAVAACFNTKSIVIPNPYAADIFVTTRESPRRGKDLVFVGRLVSEKGADILLNALALLRREGFSPTCTIVGSGPEEGRLRRLCSELALDGQVVFTGARSGHELAALMNEHRIMVVPSRYAEPFGIVALEGIACGCVVVASGGGGLPEAVGPCGLTFRNGNVAELTSVLSDLLGHASKCLQLTAHAQQHLENFQPSVIADAYLRIFRT
jgi:glycosyltransferase involved in cell wall biosynthesis